MIEILAEAVEKRLGISLVFQKKPFFLTQLVKSETLDWPTRGVI